MLIAVVIATTVFPWTVLGQASVLTVTSGEDVCHLVTVNGNPNCVTDGEGQTVRSRPSCGILDRRALARLCPRHRVCALSTPKTKCALSFCGAPRFAC